MTTQQADNVINKLHDIIDKQFCACIKATFSEAAGDKFRSEMFGKGLDYDISYGNGICYVFVTIINDSDSLYDLHNYAGYVISEIVYCQPKKIEVM